MPTATVARSAHLLTVLAAVACSGQTPGPETRDRAALQAGVDSAAKRLLTALRTNASDSLVALMTDDVVIMPPNEAVLKGKTAVRTWYDQLLTQLRTSSLMITDREVLIGGEWATELAAFEWMLVPVAGGPAVIDRGSYAQYGTVSRMDDGSSAANCGTALLRLWPRRRGRDPHASTWGTSQRPSTSVAPPCAGSPPRRPLTRHGFGPKRR